MLFSNKEVITHHSVQSFSGFELFFFFAFIYGEKYAAVTFSIPNGVSVFTSMCVLFF